MTDVKRLGKRGGYRLGRLKAQGIVSAPPPELLRPRFRRPEHRGATSGWVLAAIAGTAAIAGGAVIGLWFVPLVVGVLAGAANRFGGWRGRVLVIAVSLMTLVGWGLPLWWPAFHGVPVGGTARVIAALLGLPAHAIAGVLAALVVAIVQALAGLWLGRAITPRPADAQSRLGL
jgi:hypothetical protein